MAIKFPWNTTNSLPHSIPYPNWGKTAAADTFSGTTTYHEPINDMAMNLALLTLELKKYHALMDHLAKFHPLILQEYVNSRDAKALMGVSDDNA